MVCLHKLRKAHESRQGNVLMGVKTFLEMLNLGLQLMELSRDRLRTKQETVEIEKMRKHSIAPKMCR